MSRTIQHVSPSHVRLYLIRQPYGTFILRYPTNNDELINTMRLDHHLKPELSLNSFIVLSIRVDETVYKYEIEHCLLPYVKEDNQGNNNQLLEPYYRRRKTIQNGKFTELKEQLILPTHNNIWTLNRKHLQDMDFSALVNAGKHSQAISKASWQCEKQHAITVFIKRFNKNDWYFTHELSLLQDLCYFSIVSFYGHFSDNRFSYLVFEDGGDSLESHCPLKFRSIKRQMKFIASVGLQITQGMIYLEKKNIVHRDLTAGNVVINSYGFIRIVDFGHAAKKEEGKNNLERSQTTTGVKRFQYRFLAPECLPHARPKGVSGESISSTVLSDVYASFSSKSDVWSFGILLVQLMIDDPRTPYPLITETDDIPQHIKIQRQKHPRPNGCPTDMYLILEQCWAYEVIDRISFSELREKMLQLQVILG